MFLIFCFSVITEKCNLNPKSHQFFYREFFVSGGENYLVLCHDVKTADGFKTIASTKIIHCKNKETVKNKNSTKVKCWAKNGLLDLLKGEKTEVKQLECTPKKVTYYNF